jgi:hypothetical protein
MILRGRNSAGRNAPAESAASADLVASAALSLTLIPAFLSLDITITEALPLAVLIGLISRCLFRLILGPDRSDVFHPMTGVAGYFAIYFALRSYYLFTVPFFARIGHNPYDAYIPASLWCACIGYLAFSSGVASKIAKRCFRHVPAPIYWPRALPTLRILLLNLIGLASLMYMFKIGATVGNRSSGLEFMKNPPSGVAVLLENLIDLAWIVACMYLIVPGKKSGRGAVWPLLGVSISILCIKLAVTGGKEGLIKPFLEAAIVVHYGKRRFRIWEMVIIGIPVLMLAFGAVNFYRFVVVVQHGSSKNLADVGSRVSSAIDMLEDERGRGTQQTALDQMVERNAGADALALIMKYTPHPFPYEYGLHWLEIPLTFVPRQIWKDKPVNIPSAEFEHTYMGESASFIGFSSMQTIGDFYRNFSFVGVVCGMFLVGVLLQFFYLYCSPGRENFTGLFLYATLFPEIIHSLETDAGYAIINVSRVTVLAIGVAVFLGARFRKVQPVRIPPRSSAPMGRLGFLAIRSGDIV